MKHKRFFVWRAFIGLILLAVGLGLTACASVRPQTKPGDELNTLQDISVADQTDKTEIVITAQKPVVYTSYQLTDPPRLIVDLAGASVGKFKDRLPIGQDRVTKGAWAGTLPVRSNLGNNFLHHRLGGLHILLQNSNHRLDRHILMPLVPAVVIGRQRNRRVTDLRLPSELCLLKVRHPDHIDPPLSVNI